MTTTRMTSASTSPHLAGLPAHGDDGLRVGPDRIAVISDVHGNMTAYDAVLTDIDARSIRRIVNLGDVFGKGPRGSEAIARSKAACEVTLRGNWDACVGREDLYERPPMKWWYDELTGNDHAWLQSLPFSVDLRLSERPVRMFHASADSEFYRVHMNPSDEDFAGMFRNAPATGGGEPPEVVVYGDIHEAFIEERDGKVLINAGSVGNALDEPTAAYVVLEGISGGKRTDPLRYEIVRVPYDIEAEIKVARKSGMLEVEEYAVELRTGVYRGLQSAGVTE